ncbi:MAG: C45 family autoproteolytic acyltransferase/hydrolase [Planctomycetota bacterium]|jgi:hypothetical protein
MRARRTRLLVRLAPLLLAFPTGCTRGRVREGADVPPRTPPAPSTQPDELLARIEREDAASADAVSADATLADNDATPTRPATTTRAVGPGLVAETDGGRFRVVNGIRVLELWGSPEQMGRAHGTLLKEDIRRVISDVIDGSHWPERIMEGTRVMERHQHERHRREIRALAAAAGVDYMKIVALQLFGDAERAHVPKAGEIEEGEWMDDTRTPGLNELLERAEMRIPGAYACTNFAMFGPATATGECIAGRNFDFWYQEVAAYASLIIHYRHERPLHSFVTLTWAGVVNGWTLMNDAGICTANNLSLGVDNSLEAVSTCFLLRLVSEEAGSVAEGIEVARRNPRSGGTAMLVAGGTPPDAVELEFDHSEFHVRRAHEGWVIADNGSRVLGREPPLEPEEGTLGRYGTLLGLIKRNYGRIDRTMNFAAARGVALEGINLHSAMLFPKDLTFMVSMRTVPAVRAPFRKFRMTPRGLESAE